MPHRRRIIRGHGNRYDDPGQATSFHALAERGMPRLGRVLAFALFMMIGAIGGGNLFQADQPAAQKTPATGGEDSFCAGSGWVIGLVAATVNAVFPYPAGGLRGALRLLGHPGLLVLRQEGRGLCVRGRWAGRAHRRHRVADRDRGRCRRRLEAVVRFSDAMSFTGRARPARICLLSRHVLLRPAPELPGAGRSSTWRDRGTTRPGGRG
ncbi:hypothetical protein [Kocuria rhizosphaericola]|uniref:hypothetical protein n=1 Tax=Kocuria rhizosphaericola TaxID=3376284 RepID=UPI0037B81EC0